tara:strand:+ start:630 stop:1028 length:399 start_codon:yes stop_codon:yes gene_type:complete
MFSKDTLAGIFLSLGNYEILIEKDERLSIGYKVKLRISIRGSEDFLLAVQRSLLQNEITSRYIEQESKSRPRPILKIGGIQNIVYILQTFCRDLPNAKGDLDTFRKATRIVAEARHLRLDGLEELFKLKELM